MYTVAEAAKKLGVTPRTLRYYITAGDVRAEKVPREKNALGFKYMLSGDDLERAWSIVCYRRDYIENSPKFFGGKDNIARGPRLGS
jgi:predicted site-specific integrase-resolvase